jgi:HD-GYP domain-containing protein (c-di-GMP phosphodiesterase class II)
MVVGVLQLINRKRSGGAVITSEAAAAEHVVPYGDHEMALVQGLAGQAAVSIENARLYEQIEHIFESFVKAAVTAIDQRDPTTAGHSVRVAALTTGLADRLPRLDRGRWAGTSLSRDQMKELRYAALLHDFGKVAVREEVLVKARKLPPYLWERVQSRFDLVHRTIERDALHRKIALMEEHGPGAPVDQVDAHLQARLRRLDRFREAVRTANEPSILPEESAGILREIAEERFEQVDGQHAPILEPEELAFLSIPKGSLDDTERLEIESHVTQTYRFLVQIPWTADLSGVAEIAYGHHEKLDGRGYPRQVTGREIPVQTRMMTIADIFDALTASDRPYKRALGAERALDILNMEARDGMLDAELVELLIESKVYAEILEKDWREL